ncbi:uncharacterized protein LOC111341119 [Stylophora pistillata]|uniref:uncharacterized protein LOC111341119 n=1 Tax=Stylophora pistillata TaxID=50429 RepID=UPI000C0404AE|nr:uncharacterized protein LOC111341119 [Stylophora pistillata]
MCIYKGGRHGWSFVARLSNCDTKHWMNESGQWWFDKNEAFGKTTDPSDNTDMISPLFWLLNGSDFKITRSDDSMHAPLLQTIDNCLGSQTLRSKVTNYGDFRNGKVWPEGKCLGKCKVQYGGQYQMTEGFGKATCSGEMQAADEVGFWCEWGWSGAVIMIGGARGACGRTDHGIGVTTAKKASFKKEDGRPEYDFGNSGWGSHTRSYSLNLWIK